MKISHDWNIFRIRRKRLCFMTNILIAGFWNRLKYCLVHASAKIMLAISNARAKMTIHYVSYIPEMILVMAVGIGLYTQWSMNENVMISVISIFGAFIFAISCALRYYFGLEDLGKSLFHLWIGCLIGILAFINNSQLQYVTTEEVMETLFMLSMVFGWCWNLVERCLKLKTVEAKLLTVSEGLESAGLIIASIVTGVDSVALSLYTIAYIFHISAMRLKSFMGFLSFVAFIFVGIFLFFPALEVKPNVYALACFVGRHAFQPVIDYYFCGLSMIDRWRSFFDKPRLVRYLFVLLMLMLEIMSAVIVGISTSRHKEWYIVLPLYLVLAIFWLMFHLMTFLTCWKLMGKMTECNVTADEKRSFNRIMAAKGLRYFGLVSQRIIFLSLVSSVIVFVIGFETRTPYSLAMAFLMLPVEAAIVSLFWELGDNLGGTCTGYAIIAPVTSAKPGAAVQLLTSAEVHEISFRGTSALNDVQQLFSYQMIQNFGCDYSSSGLELDNLQNKLKAFFDRHTSDGPRFDTYVLYYSGDVYDTGDWALSDNKSLSLAMLLSWWKEIDKGTGSRLILVLDTPHSYKWAQATQSVRSCFLAVQTCRYIGRPEIAETGEKCGVGTFTRAYVHFNNDQKIEVDWTSKSRPLRALYKVSQNWCDFSFHLPTLEDIESYWRTNFPPVMKPLMKVVNIPSLGSLICCCWCCLRWLRWLQMRWLPPQQLDTGHGLQLLNT